MQAIQLEAFNNLPALATVNLNHNNLSAIRNGMFNLLKCLTNLKLKNNTIETIENGSFDSMKNRSCGSWQKRIDLSYNQLKNIQKGIFNGIPIYGKYERNIQRVILTPCRTRQKNLIPKIIYIKTGLKLHY